MTDYETLQESQTPEGELPKGWIRAELKQLADLVYRYPTFYGMEHLDKGIPVIRGEHLQKDGTVSHDWSDYWYVAPELSEKFPNTVVKLHDLVMSVRGSVGKIGLIDEQLIGSQVSPNCIRISLNQQTCEPKFVLYYLKSTSGGASVQENTNSTTIQTIKASLLIKTVIPLAPLAEQKRVVEAIESLFTQLDAGVTALKRLRANLKRYKAAVLKAACEGKLVPQDPNDEPAEDLLKRILKERRAKWEAEQRTKGKDPRKLKYDEPAAPDTSDLPDLPEGWVWTKIKDVGDVKLGRQRAPQHHTGLHMRPYLRVANVFEDYIDTSDILEMNFTPSEYEIYHLVYGDILLNEGQSLELVGRSAIYRDELPGACFQNTLVRFQASSVLLVEYAQYVFRAYFHSGRFQKIAKWTTTMAHLGAQRFADLEFPLPPLPEQERIITEVEAIMSVVNVLESTISMNLHRAERLRQAILKQAFEGKLVPQDPNDEPASELLKRVRQQRKGGR